MGIEGTDGVLTVGIIVVVSTLIIHISSLVILVETVRNLQIIILRKIHHCSSDCDCEIDDLHTHFYCTHCRRIFCLRGVAVPQVGLPDGFSAETINFVIKGICADCSGRN